MNYLLFAVAFLYLVNFFQVNKLLLEMGKSKKVGEKIKDQKVINTIKKNTGLEIDYIYVFDSKKPFGMMLD